MDWQGLNTAYLDRERTRLGLPSRLELEEKRAMEARRAAESASALETQGLTREKTRAEIAALPAEQDLTRRLREAQIRNYDETSPGVQGTLRPLVSADGEITGFYNEKTGEIKTNVPPGLRTKAVPPPGSAGDRAAWTPQYDAAGKLLGATHMGQFHSRESMGVPEGARRPLAAGEKSELALMDNPARLPNLFRSSVEQVRSAEKENPVAAGTGPFMGRIGNVYRANVDTSGPGGDFDAARKQVRQVVYGLSGKQLNASELQWLDSITPNLSDPGVDQQINRFDAFITALIEAKRQGQTDPFSAAQLSFGIQKAPAPPAAPGAPPATPGAGQVKIQRSPSTGKSRYSTDGGATWQPGLPPQ